jgi:hypothetical protein
LGEFGQFCDDLRLRLFRLYRRRRKRKFVWYVVFLVVPACAHDDSANPGGLLPVVRQRPPLVVGIPFGDLLAVEFSEQLLDRLAERQC